MPHHTIVLGYYVIGLVSLLLEQFLLDCIQILDTHLCWFGIVDGQNLLVFITKTYLFSCDPLKPHFYIVKLEFIGVYIIFLISAQNIDCGTH